MKKSELDAMKREIMRRLPEAEFSWANGGKHERLVVRVGDWEYQKIISRGTKSGDPREIHNSAAGVLAAYRSAHGR